MKNFLIQSAKIAIALTMTCFLLGVLGWGIYQFNAYRENFKNAPLETPKTWIPLTLEPLDNAEASLITKWYGGKMSYQFALRGYPLALSQKRDTQTYNPPKFTLTFLDKNGFKIFEHEINFSEMTKIVDATGKPVGLTSRGDSYESADEYTKATSWEVTWSF